MRPPLEHNEARWRLLRRLALLGEGSADDLLPAVMPPYRDKTTPRMLLASLTAYGVAAVGKRNRRGTASYVVTEKGRAAVSAGKREEVFR